MRRTRQQRMAMTIAVILAAILLIGIIGAGIASLIPEAGAITQSQIDKLKDNKKALEKEKASIQNELKSLKNDKADAIAQKKALDQEINIIELQIENTTQLISELALEIGEKQAELDAAMLEEAETFELFRTRVRAMEEAGNVTFLSVIFKSRSFSDLLDRWDMISEIMKADQALMEDLTKKREHIKAVKAQLEVDKAEQYESRRELSERQAELAEQYAEADELIAQLSKEMTDKEAEWKKQQEEEAKANAEIAKAEAELKKQLEAAKKNTKYVGGELLWPVPGYYTISSGYGIRTHPILKVKKQHNGIDIPAPKGTKIVAANSGTVIMADYNSSYGYFIVIDHGGGKTTLYAHQSKFASGIKAGKQVSRGDTIGYVGSTGMSTGPHLHFEVRENGVPKNPETYVKPKK